MNRRKLHKYNVSSKERRTVDGITFDSMTEMNRYLELKKAGGRYTISPTSNTLKTVKLSMKM